MNISTTTHKQQLPGQSPPSRHRQFILTVAFTLAFAAVYFVLGDPVGVGSLSSFSNYYNPLRNLHVDVDDDDDKVSEEVRLDRLLKKVSMVDKTVIITTLNAAWARPGSILDLFLEGFRSGEGTRRLLDHLMIVAFDHEAYERCRLVHSHCFALTTDGVDFSGQKNFMSEDYLKMMWRRIDFLRIVLQMGYDFIFTDADIIWFRNPLPQFSPESDFQISCDQFSGNPTDLSSNAPNGGFNYVRSNNRTISFYRFWYESRLNHPNKHDQDVLNLIKSDPFVHDELGLRIRFLDTVYFGGLCQPSKDMSKVCTMHVNCCVGLSRKVNDLTVLLDDWRRFVARPPSINGSRLPSWSVPQNCSLDPI